MKKLSIISIGVLALTCFAFSAQGEMAPIRLPSSTPPPASTPLCNIFYPGMIAVGQPYCAYVSCFAQSGSTSAQPAVTGCLHGTMENEHLTFGNSGCGSGTATLIEVENQSLLIGVGTKDASPIPIHVCYGE